MENTATQLEEAIFNSCEGIYRVDHKANSYQTLKSDSFLSSLIDECGSYTAFFKLVITAKEAYNAHSKAFLSFIQQHSYDRIYSRKIQLTSNSETRVMTMIYYPVPGTETAYITLSLLPERFTARDMAAAKQKALNDSYLFTMLVSLDQDAVYNAHVTELSIPDQDLQILRFSDWRSKVLNMILPEHRTLFLEKTELTFIRRQLSFSRRYYFDIQMQNMEGRFLWTRHSLIQVQNEEENSQPLFVYTVQDIEAEKKTSAANDSSDISENSNSEDAPAAASAQNQHISALSTLILERIKDEIDNHYMEKLSLDMMAKKYYMNAAYLGQLFIRKYKLSFHEYLTKRRMEEAAALLSGTTYTIRQIIDLVGISNPQYFNRLFRRYFQCSPTEYRRKL